MLNLITNIENQLNQPNLFFDTWQVLWRIIITALLFYFLLIFVLNMFGNASLANLSTYDFIATLAIGSTVSSNVISEETTIINGLAATLMFLGLQFLMTLLSSRWPKLHNLMNPNPKVLFMDDQFIEENLKRTRITKEEILSAIRLQGQTTSDQIFAVLIESNGELSIIKNATEDRKHEITKYLK